MPVKKHIIRLQDVNKTFRIGGNDIEILKEVNVHVYPREFTILYGPSGSGKSTLLNTMIGLEQPTTGKVYVDGKDVSRMNENQRAEFRNQNIGVMYQQAHWVKTLSVLENVALPLLIGKKDESFAYARAEYALSQVGLGDFGKRNPVELSGGQQQRVGIARALVSDPQLLMTDEPTGNLDTTSSDQIMQMLVGLVREFGRTLIMVTHELRFLQLADRAFLIEDGRIRQNYDKAALIEIMKNYEEPLKLEDAD